MPDLRYVVLLFVILFAAAGGGTLVRALLPERHRSRESIELIQLTITLLVTFTSIVLALLTGSVKTGFDAAYQARGTYAASFVQLDQCLRDYGAETDPMRSELRSYVARVIASTWPDEPPPANIRFPDTKDMPITGESPVLGAILDKTRTQLRMLQPTDEPHQRILNDCLREFSDLIKTRWAVIESAPQSIAPPFYWVLTLWLVILFASFGLTAPPNPVTIIVVGLSALSITIAVGVIADLDEPYGGVFGISSDSMRHALEDMER
jgi:hypothetical protein